MVFTSNGASPRSASTPHASEEELLPVEEQENRDTTGTSLAATAVNRFSGLLVLGAFIIVYALWVPDTFLTSTTAQGIVADQAVIGIMAIGLVFALSAGAFDVSFAATMGLSGVVCASLVTWHGLPIPVAIAASLATGLAIGALNAFFVVVVRLNSIVVTLGTSSIIGALNSRLSNGGQYIVDLPGSFTQLAAPRPFGVPIVAVHLGIVAIIAWYVLEHTPVGRRIQATGSGPDAARLAGVNTGRMVVIAFLVSGFLSALAGVLATARTGVGVPGIGAGYLLPAFAAVFLGTTQVKPGRFNVWGTILSIFLLATGVKGLQLAGGESWVTDAFNGCALILAVSLSAMGLRERRRGRYLQLFRLRKRRITTPDSP